MAEEVGIDRKHEEGSGMKLRDGKGVGFRHVGVPERITQGTDRLCLEEVWRSLEVGEL